MPRDPQGAGTRSPKLRKPLHELSMSRLKQLECGLCGQRLDRMKRSAKNCSAMVCGEEPPCNWHQRLNGETTTTITREPIQPHAGEETKG